LSGGGVGGGFFNLICGGGGFVVWGGGGGFFFSAGRGGGGGQGGFFSTPKQGAPRGPAARPNPFEGGKQKKKKKKKGHVPLRGSKEKRARATGTPEQHRVRAFLFREGNGEKRIYRKYHAGEKKCL